MKAFYVNLKYPMSKILEIEVEIKVGKTVRGIFENGRYGILGCSVFLTRPSAERAKRGALEKTMKNSYLRWHHPKIYEAAVRELRTLH